MLESMHCNIIILAIGLKAERIPVQGGVIHEEGDVIFAVGVGGLEVDEHPKDRGKQLVQPGFCWQGKAWLPFLHSDIRRSTLPL